MQHDSHVNALLEHIMRTIEDALGIIRTEDAWGEWSRYAAQGEW